MNYMDGAALNRRLFDLAEEHCQRCLAYSKRYGLEGEELTTTILTTLRSHSHLRHLQGNVLDAVTFAEEAYNLVVEAYDSVHPNYRKLLGN
jgi:hypothetical protein